MKCDFSHLHAVSAGIIIGTLTVPVTYQGKVTGGEIVR
jgi:hypothetical protein